jgi:hypothetical protein
MLVFHESNSRLKDIHCAHNVKFIDLGENGLSKLIVAEVLSATANANDGKGEIVSEDSRNELNNYLSNIMIHIPRYLVEVKPMTGTLFKDWLAPYSHWSYTDPDIIWGNLTNWVEVDDFNKYEVVTLAKIFDAGRLFIRGQVSDTARLCVFGVRYLFIFMPHTYPNDRSINRSSSKRLPSTKTNQK